MSDIVNNLMLRISVVGASEADDEIESLDLRLDTLGESSAKANAGVDGLGKALTSMKALLAGYGIYEAIKQYSSFSASMERLQTQAGATGREVALQTRNIMSASVGLATGPNSLAQGMYHLESANIRGSKAFNDLKIAAEGAQIGGANLTDTVTGLTAAMFANFKGIHSASQAMGILNATVGAGDMTMQNLNEGLGTGILATLKVLGLQLNDFGAAMATFGDNNIRGAAAANRLRMSLMTLVHPSEVAQQAMSNIGLSEYQLATVLHQHDGLLDMLELLHTRLAGLTKIQTETDLASIFGGGKNSAGIMTLYDQMDKLQSKYVIINKGQNDFNREWVETQHTLAYSLHQLEALGEVMLIKVGGGLAVVVHYGSEFLVWLSHGSIAAQGLQDVLFMVAAAFLLIKVRAIGAGIASAVTATEFGATAVAGLGLVTSITSISDATYLMSAAFDAIPIIGWISLGLTLVMIALRIKAVRHAIVDVFNWAREHWQLLAAIFSPILGPLGAAIMAFQTLYHVVKAVWDLITNGSKNAGRDLTAIAHSLGFGGNSMASYINPVGIASHLGSLISGFFADGGNVMQSGAYVVGERGPEIVYLPSGAYVQPNDRMNTTPAPGQFTGGSGGPVILQLVVDGKILAQQVVREGLAAQARM